MGDVETGDAYIVTHSTTQLCQLYTGSGSNNDPQFWFELQRDALGLELSYKSAHTKPTGDLVAVQRLMQWSTAAQTLQALKCIARGDPIVAAPLACRQL